MEQLIERITLPTFIQVVLECWNNVFLLIMIISLLVRKIPNEDTDTDGNERILLTDEIITFYIAIFLYNLFNIICCMADGDTGKTARITKAASEFMYFATGAFLTLFFLQVVKKYIAQRNGNLRLKYAVTAVQLLNIPGIILLTATPFTNALYYFDDGNLYHRGLFYPVWYYTTIVLFVFIVAVYVHNLKRIDPFLVRVVNTAALIPLIAFICNFTYSLIPFNNVSVSITALIVFILHEKNKAVVMADKAKEHEKTQRLLAENRLAMMYAQIEPHFINNTMNAVAELCHTDPERAAETITHFSGFLQDKIEAVDRRTLVPLYKEIELIKEYLAVEYADTNKVFRVEYDIKKSDFRIPQLTIQPLVENAVRHGIDRYSDKSLITIRTYEDEDNIFITVADNGTAEKDEYNGTAGKRSIGLDNISERLKLECNGEVIVNTDDNGTVATIRLPKE